MSPSGPTRSRSNCRVEQNVIRTAHGALQCFLGRLAIEPLGDIIGDHASRSVAHRANGPMLDHITGNFHCALAAEFQRGQGVRSRTADALTLLIFYFFLHQKARNSEHSSKNGAALMDCAARFYLVNIDIHANIIRQAIKNCKTSRS